MRPRSSSRSHSLPSSYGPGGAGPSPCSAARSPRCGSRSRLPCPSSCACTGWWERVGDRADTALRDFNEVLVPVRLERALGAPRAPARGDLRGGSRNRALRQTGTATVGRGHRAARDRGAGDGARSSVSASPPASSSSPRASGWSRPHVVVSRAATAARSSWGAPSSSPRQQRRRRRRTEQLGCRLEELGSLLPRPRAGRRRLRLGGQLQRDPLPREAHDGPARARLGRSALLARLDPGCLRRQALGRVPLPAALRRSTGTAPGRSFAPASARDETGWVRQQVEVVGLRSNRLPAASTPVALESSSLARVSFLGGGVLGYRGGRRTRPALHGLEPCATTAAGATRCVAPRYPEETARYLTLSGGQLPPSVRRPATRAFPACSRRRTTRTCFRTAPCGSRRAA